MRESSDIDIHVFTDDLELIFHRLQELAWVYEEKMVDIFRAGKVEQYTHLYLFNGYPIELSVYPLLDIRVSHRSSTDGKPIQRLKPTALRALIAQDHPEQWDGWVRRPI